MCLKVWITATLTKVLALTFFDASVLKDKTIRQNVAEFITNALNSNNLPDHLRDFRLNLLSKTRSSEVKVEDTRPIAIGSHLLKIVEKNNQT